MAAAVFSLPIALAFWYATKYVYEATGELWTARYIAFGVSYITFPFLTHYFLNESMLTPKTLVCPNRTGKYAGLMILIVGIQFYWK